MKQTAPRPAAKNADRTTLILAALGVLGTALVLLNTAKSGAALSPDSAFYVSAARNLLAGRGLVGFDGRPLVTWPPLFPLILAGFGRIGVEPVTAARFVNALAFGAAVFLAGFILSRNVRSRFLVYVGTVAVMVSRGFFGTAIVVWTEPLFALFLALAIVFLGRFCARGRPLDFAATVILIALAPMQRYVGVVLIPAVALAVLVSASGTLRRRLGYAAAALALPAIPIGLWFLRNARVSGSVSGERPGLFTAVGPTLFEFSRTVLRWSLPDKAARSLGVFAVVIVLGLCAAVAWLVLAALRRRNGAGPAQVRFALIAFGIYVAGLLAVVSPEGLSQLDRLVAPVFFLWVLLLAVAAEQVVARWKWKPARPAVFALAVLALVSPSLRLAGATRNDIRYGVGGFEGETWRGNKVVAWLRANPVDGPIVSNEPAAVYLVAGYEARMSPRRGADPAAERPANGTTLVWFRRVVRPELMTPDELNAAYGLDKVASTEDGGVARFR